MFIYPNCNDARVVACRAGCVGALQSGPSRHRDLRATESNASRTFYRNAPAPAAAVYQSTPYGQATSYARPGGVQPNTLAAPSQQDRSDLGCGPRPVPALQRGSQQSLRTSNGAIGCTSRAKCPSGDRCRSRCLQSVEVATSGKDRARQRLSPYRGCTESGMLTHRLIHAPRMRFSVATGEIAWTLPHWQPVRGRSMMVSKTARTSIVYGRQPDAAAGIRDATSTHCALVTRANRVGGFIDRHGLSTHRLRH